jgi:hypothetical protein
MECLPRCGSKDGKYEEEAAEAQQGESESSSTHHCWFETSKAYQVQAAKTSGWNTSEET